MTSSAAAQPSTLDGALLAAASPAAWAYIVSGGRWLPFEHLLAIDDHIMRAAAGEIPRLIIEAPVRHGKSELVCRHTPAWWLGRHPEHQVMLASYEAMIARSWGRKARDELAEHGAAVFGVVPSSTPAAAEWWTVEGHEGVMVTAGVGGALTGKGADLLIIDDPVKNAEEAQSTVQREKVWDWWRSTARSRLQPGGRVIIVMARWHEDDLVGRLLAADDEEWTVLRLPALAEADDPLGRPPGAPLCPEMFDLAALEGTRRALGSYWFAALLQQAPAPPEGLLFHRADFRYWREAAAEGARFYVLGALDGERRYDAGLCMHWQTVDVAASAKQTADFTVCATWARTPDGDLLLLDVRRRRFELLRVADFLRECSDAHGQPPMWVEHFGHGTGPVQQLKRDGYPVRSLGRQHGAQLEKVARAQSAVAAYERGAVFHPQAPTFDLDAFEAELLMFPHGTHDDQVDVTAYAARLLPLIGEPVKQQTPEDAPKPLSAGVLTRRF